MSKKLLLADDSITIQKVIQITFAHEDYELAITDNGDAALAKAQEINPDLIMADVYMPGKNGYELTTAIRQDPALQNVPVLLLAGSFEPFDEDKAMACQANAWIEKPFESQNLIDKVAELLSAAPAATEAPAPPVEAGPAVEAAAPVQEEVAMASDDPFGDISFAEETPEVAPEPEPLAGSDDWSDITAEPEMTAPVVEDTPIAEEPQVQFAEDLSFAEEPPAADELPPIAEAPAIAEIEPDVFDMADEEIMPLDDDDILGAEDLEPAPAEQTLAAWSRDEAADDVFAESMDEVPVADEDVFAAEEPAFVEEAPVEAEVAEIEETSVFEEPVSETPVFAEPAAEAPVAFAESAIEEPPAFAEPVAEPIPVEEDAAAAEAPALEEEPEPADVAAAMVDVEARAAALSEDDIEQIIEKVVAGVVEKLAGTILERVAWEVVPDMAENLIRDEIRKIKDAAA